MKPALRRIIGVTISMSFFLGALVLFFAFIVPTASEIQELRGERNALSTLLEVESARIETVRRLFEEYGSVSTLQSTLGKALPRAEEVPGIINQLNGMAKASDVTISSLDINLPAIKAGNKEDVIKPVGKVQVTFTVTGDYKSIKSYLDSIETNVRVMDVEKLGLQGGAEGTTLSYNIVVSAYYQL